MFRTLSNRSQFNKKKKKRRLQRRKQFGSVQDKNVGPTMMLS